MAANLKLAKVLWAATAALAFAAALGGIVVEDIYVGVFPPEFLPGALPQDVLTLFVSALLFTLALTTRRDHVKRQVVIVALLGSLFYLYGIFTMERVYNAFYLLYAAVFALSFWAIVATLAGFRAERFADLRIGSRMRKTTAFSSIFIAVVFTVLWTAALIPLMRDHNRIDYLYSIYILDLCFVMPAFAIAAVMSLRRMPFGILMGPAIMIVGFFVIFPLGLNELAKPSAGVEINYGPMVVSFGFALYMLAVGVLQLRRIRFE